MFAFCCQDNCNDTSKPISMSKTASLYLLRLKARVIPIHRVIETHNSHVLLGYPYSLYMGYRWNCLDESLSYGNLSPSHNRQKRSSPLIPFALRSKKGTWVNTALLWQKKERGKRKQCLFIEGALLCLLLFTFISYLSKQHKYNCLYKTNRVEKGMDR